MSRFLDERYSLLQPYVPGEQPQQRQYIKLNTNESPFPPSEKAVAAAQQEAQRLNLYPDPAADDLVKALAQTLGVKGENVFVCNGSDEVLAFIFQALCPAGAAFADITYGFYPVYAQLYGTNARVVPLRHGFALSPADYSGLGRTIVIANPNAPTGLALARAEVEEILRSNPSNLVVVDEAYVDFGAETALPLLAHYDNLMVVGTFSKSRSMAGARLGYAVASKALIEDLNRVKFSFNPYNLNRMTMAAGMGALADPAYFAANCAAIAKTRDETAKRLEAMGFTLTKSLANFVFASHGAIKAEVLYNKLKARGILVRWFSKARIDNHLRITIGTQQQMDALLDGIKDILTEYGV